MDVWSLMKCSLCSYVGDVNIQATVKPALPAGIKELKVSAFVFQLSVLVLLSSQCLTVLNPPAQGDDEGHFRAPRWSGTTGGRSHLLFHPPPGEWDTLPSWWMWTSVDLTPKLFFQTLQIDWTGTTNILDSPAFRLVSTPNILFFRSPSLIPSVSFQFFVSGYHRGHDRFAHGAAQPHVFSSHRPGQSGPDEVPSASGKTSYQPQPQHFKNYTFD